MLETSFVVDALIDTQSRHEECQAFLEDIATAESTIFFNRLLEAELWETAYVIALRELHPSRRARDVRHDGRARRRARRLREEVEIAWHEVLDAVAWVDVDLGEVAQWLPEMMGFGLSSYDAVHAATAACVDVLPFVTLDYHFSFVPQRQLELYVPANRVRPCRDRRA